MRLSEITYAIYGESAPSVLQHRGQIRVTYLTYNKHSTKISIIATDKDNTIINFAMKQKRLIETM